MTSDTTINTSTLKITHDDVVNIITCIINMDGLEEAKTVFKQLNAVFSTQPGWKETAAGIYKLFADKRREEQQQLRLEKLEELRAAASSVLVLNKNDLTGIGTVSQANLVTGDDPEITFEKHN